jgi:hypothetical protein
MHADSQRYFDVRVVDVLHGGKSGFKIPSGRVRDMFHREPPGSRSDFGKSKADQRRTETDNVDELTMQPKRVNGSFFRVCKTLATL